MRIIGLMYDFEELFRALRGQTPRRLTALGNADLAKTQRILKE